MHQLSPKAVTKGQAAKALDQLGPVQASRTSAKGHAHVQHRLSKMQRAFQAWTALQMSKVALHSCVVGGKHVQTVCIVVHLARTICYAHLHAS